MDINMLQKRIHKLLIISAMMVLSILVMAFLFIDHGDDSLNHATYTTMNQEIDYVNNVFLHKNTQILFC